MDERAVVTVFLRNDGQVLLLQRSADVGSYPGQWGAVAGHAEGDTDAAALEEIQEETGIEPSAVTHVTTGNPFEVVDDDLDIRWTVTPYLFDCATRSIETDWETAAFEWVHPTEILTRDTVPDLWTSYDRVRPVVETVVEDTVHGSASISIRALEVLRDEAALLSETDGGWTDIAAIGETLRDARPEMAAVRNRVNQVLATASDERTPVAVHEEAREAIEAAVSADSEAAENAAEHISGARVFTLSRSGTVRAALETSEPKTVCIAISEPGSEGAKVAESLAEDGFDVVLTSDANIPGAVADSDVVLVGADTVCRDGDVVNKVGTTAAMLAAQHFEVPAYTLCAAAKISAEDCPDIESAADELAGYSGSDADLILENPIFERTPGELIDGVITESGVLDREGVRAVADQYAEAAGWSD